MICVRTLAWTTGFGEYSLAMTTSWLLRHNDPAEIEHDVQDDFPKRI